MMFNRLIILLLLLPGNFAALKAFETDSIVPKVKFPLGKGVVFAGISGGANLRSADNETNLFGGKILDQDKRGFNLLISGGYMILPDFAVGAAWRYDRNKSQRTSEDGDGIASFIQEAGTTITTSVYGKYFIPVTSNRRINLFNIAGVAWVNDRQLTENTSKDILNRTYVLSNKLQLGINPGIQVFVMEGFATEVGVNIGGLSGGKKRSFVNGIESSAVNTFDVDLRINILSMNISFYYYFPTKK
jgi:hypothetical protein